MNKRLSILTTAVLFASSLTVLISSCGKDDDPTPDPVMVATSIELVSGGTQTAFAEEALENAIEVMVKDQEGNAFAGEVVNFAVTEGSVSVATVATGANGKASVTWTLGATEGTQTLTITGTSTLTGSPLNVTASAEYKPVIGDFKYGGVIFYIDDTEKHGLVCAVTDQSTGAEWGCSGETTGADGTAIGTGVTNTAAIIAAGCGTSAAAGICTNLTLNSFDDWFLPSIDEGVKMNDHKAIINATATANGGTAFSEENNAYWSSSEHSNNLAALAFGFKDDGGLYGGHAKGNLNYVRAVREF